MLKKKRRGVSIFFSQDACSKQSLTIMEINIPAQFRDAAKQHQRKDYIVLPRAKCHIALRIESWSAMSGDAQFPVIKID